MMTFEGFFLRMSAIGFLIGAAFGLFTGMWCYMTLFWSDSMADKGMIVSVVMIALCVVAILRITEKEKEAKKDE